MPRRDQHTAVMSRIIWKDLPDEHDYPAAAQYLALLAEAAEVDLLVRALQGAAVQHWKAKDLLRASRLALLPKDNRHVAADLAKIAGSKALSPVLLVRGDVATGRALQVADGYHRVCASYYTDENEDIPCKLVSYGGGAIGAARTREAADRA